MGRSRRRSNMPRTRCSGRRDAAEPLGRPNQSIQQAARRGKRRSDQGERSRGGTQDDSLCGVKAAVNKARAGDLLKPSGPACEVPGKVTVHVDDLLVQIAHGSRSALAELYDLLAPLLLALLRSRGRSLERAHNALVDAFARIWRRAPPTSRATAVWTGSSIRRRTPTPPGWRNRPGSGGSAGSRDTGQPQAHPMTPCRAPEPKRSAACKADGFPCPCGFVRPARHVGPLRLIRCVRSAPQRACPPAVPSTVRVCPAHHPLRIVEKGHPCFVVSRSPWPPSPQPDSWQPHRRCQRLRRRLGGRQGRRRILRGRGGPRQRGIPEPGRPVRGHLRQGEEGTLRGRGRLLLRRVPPGSLTLDRTHARAGPAMVRGPCFCVVASGFAAAPAPDKHRRKAQERTLGPRHRCHVPVRSGLQAIDVRRSSRPGRDPLPQQSVEQPGGHGRSVAVRRRTLWPRAIRAVSDGTDSSSHG